jgi:hypothetical protein
MSQDTNMKPGVTPDIKKQENEKPGTSGTQQAANKPELQGERKAL